MDYYAHSNNGDPSGWQPLEDHLKQVAELAAQFAEPFGGQEWARHVGWLHDFGKATQAFQAYLMRSNELDDSEYATDGSMSNHASAGAAWAMEHKGRCVGAILAYLCVGHHAGLPDAQIGSAALPSRLEEGRRNLQTLHDFSAVVTEKLTESLHPPSYVRDADFHLWIRMLFSCLVDADYLDTETFMNPEKTDDRGGYPELAALADQFFNHMAGLEQKANASPVNSIRKEIRLACELAAEKDRGLFSLSVPTGGGKTLSAIAFAFRHVQHHRDQRFRRIIYVIPYTSIIEQTARILAGIFGRENVVEHHSNLSPEKETVRSRMASENWDAPIIVTTNVQFFESLYAAKPSRCRKLHNLVNSIVILDEAQMLPPKWLTPCVDVINRLVENYGVTLLLATATQPALPGLKPATEMIPTELDLYRRLKRTEIHPPPSMEHLPDWDVIAAKLVSHEQVLCIVNTRRDCYDLYKQMPTGTIHLSALMCGRHRSAVIRLIKHRLRKRLPIRVVSTQLVEAGVDIDFPVVYRAFAGLDSIAQAAGRCDREGKMTEAGTPGQVHVFVPPNPAPPGLLRKGEGKMRELLSVPGLDLQDPETFHRYFTMFYSAVNDTGEKWLHDLLVKDANPHLSFQFRTAAKEFQLIENQGQQAVFVRYGKSGKWLKQLQTIGPTRENLRALQRYTVNLSKWNVEKAKEDGLLEDLWQGEYWGWAPTYDRCLGVDIFGAGWTPDDLIA
jgi:CRISPR-associated endonuclease/helicase Cas3